MTAVDPPRTADIQIARFEGGGRWIAGGGLVGVVLIAITLIGAAVSANPAEAMYAYLVAFAYWCGLAMASLVLLMIMHATRARWVTVIRRPIEIMAASILVFLLLAIPILAKMKHIYLWIDPPASLGKEALERIAHKRAYLNREFFTVRLLIYFVLWGFVAERLYRWSLRQDTSGAIDSIHLLQRQRSLGAGALPFVALSFSFAAFDWLMSLTPTWYSTIYGVYYFAGSFVSALSLLAVVTYLGRDKNLPGNFMSIEHTHSVGKLMLAFTCFWGYIGFSQFMLIWIAGIPEEVPFFITRLHGSWAVVGVILIFGQFFIPFGALLSRPLKRDPRRLAFVGLWILFIHYIDIFWLAMPALDEKGVVLRWSHFTAFFGVGLTAIAFALWRLRGRFAVPVKDPYLAESLRYRQPQ
jgi:hypothetical protein